MTITATSDWRELARRTGDGLEVALLWSKSGNRVKVAVSDERLCHHLDFEIAGENALSAFHHPFAYATSHLHAIDESWDVSSALHDATKELTHD